MDELQSPTESERFSNKDLENLIKDLMKNKRFLVDVASACHLAYFESVGVGPETDGYGELFSQEEKQLLLGEKDDNDYLLRNKYDAAQHKLAISLAGFYALSEGLDIVSGIGSQNIGFESYQTLQRLASGSEKDGEAKLFSVLAHLSWAAGQPFRGRETRDVLMPYDLLPEEEKVKDMPQIRAAAKTLVRYLITDSSK